MTQHIVVADAYQRVLGFPELVPIVERPERIFFSGVGIVRFMFHEFARSEVVIGGV